MSPDPQKDFGGDPVCGLDLMVLKAYRIGKIERLKQQAEPPPAPCPASLRVDVAGQRRGQKRNEIESFVETWMDLETVIQSEVSQKERNKYRILTDVCGT